jgi:hypothetical protein
MKDDTNFFFLQQLASRAVHFEVVTAWLMVAMTIICTFLKAVPLSNNFLLL